MLKIYTTLLLISAFILSAVAQDTMYIHKKNNEILKIPIIDIDSITFYNNNVISNTVADIDGNIYRIETFGTQTWMLENLRVTKSPSGTDIQSFIYNNESTNEATYGRLYTWDVAMNGSKTEKTQGICPDGWHIPSDDEFKTLEKYLGMTQSEADMTNTWRGTDVGTKFKSKDEGGFEIILSGRMNPNGSFGFIGSMEYTWTSTQFGDYYAWRRCFSSSDNTVGRWNSFQKTYGFSIRCVKN